MSEKESCRWIYHPTEDNKARFLLGEKGERTLICIGINPSTAEPNNLDNTLSSVRRFAYSWGYDSWQMFNVYPQRATNPNDLHLELDQDLHQQNLEAMNKFLAEKPCDIWAAWGTIIKKRSYLSRCLYDITQLANISSCNWYHVGKRSIEGHPHHPLYLKKELQPLELDINDYLKKIIKI